MYRPFSWPTLFAILALITLQLGLPAETHRAHADDWPQWMGPERDGVWRETGILKTFPADGPRVRWRTKIGGG